MSNLSSPKKRKPDKSISEMNHDEMPSCSKRPRQKNETQVESKTINDQLVRLERIREIIDREFTHEIKSKETQLEEIDERLEEANALLHRLRYAIVAEYYKKQEQPQVMLEATKAMQNQATAQFDKTALQTAIHPSLKKIIGKRPANLEDIMKACPKRAAAQNAKHGLCTRTAAQRRQERQKEKNIREQGFVIDHTKEGIKEEPSCSRVQQSTNHSTNINRLEAPKPHVLVSSRLCNKSKCLFAVGNTSKYIKCDTKIVGNVSFTHKWLVYVQTKDSDVPIEKYLKKVRFFLHPSYRPNDIVDVHQPPFQVARRGWGEFPMRIQLFFYDKFQQKPVQLIHKVVLDTTKSGRHTLGAETIMEVWLRDETIKAKKAETQATNVTTTNTNATEVTTNSKPRTVSITNMKEVFDDNFLDFLNKIEETRSSVCADIEKIEPTVVVNEPLEPRLTKSPLKQTPPTHISPYRTRTASFIAAQNNQNNASQLPTSIKNATDKLNAVINEEIPKSPKPNTDNLESFNHLTNNTNEHTASPSKNPSNSNQITPKGKVFNNVCGTVILPVTKPQAIMPQTTSTTQSNINVLTKTSVFQRKTVQIVDAQGKIKTVQVLVSTAKTLPAPPATKLVTAQAQHSANALQSNSETSLVTTKTVNTNRATINTNNTATLATVRPQPNNIKTTTNLTTLNNINSTGSRSPKNVVFQKEGKLYIIDPLQMKLRQQQKHQVSLLKPQIKQQQQQQQQQQQSNLIQTIATDHDYVPQPPQKTQTNLSMLKNSIGSLLRTPPPSQPILLKSQDLQKLRRIQFEKRFYRLNFSSMRSAVEYLLRRLPLVVFDKDSPAAAFSFVRTTPQEFHSLPAFKQRSCEWLRAKFISRLLRNLKSLQQLDANKLDPFWSTREIIMFARYFAYTPPIKSLSIVKSNAAAVSSNTPAITIPGSKEHLAAIIKNEMQNEKLHLEYDSLSQLSSIQQWLDGMQSQLKQFQDQLNDEAPIVIDSDSSDVESKITASNSKATITKRIYGSPLKFDTDSSRISFLPSLARLETASQFVGETCKDFSIRLQPEEILPGVVHPMAQTLLAHILKVFVDRLLRQSIANQMHRTQTENVNCESIPSLPQNRVERSLTMQDLRKAVLESNDLDFLTNRYLGVPKNPIKMEPNDLTEQ